eukprot:1197138-Rhodomonas_salina.6
MHYPVLAYMYPPFRPAECPVLTWDMLLPAFNGFQRLCGVCAAAAGKLLPDALRFCCAMFGAYLACAATRKESTCVQPSSIGSDTHHPTVKNRMLLPLSVYAPAMRSPVLTFHALPSLSTYALAA